MEPISTYANNVLIVAGSRKIPIRSRKSSCRLDALFAISKLQKRRPGPFSLDDLFKEMQSLGSPYRKETLRRIALYDMAGRKAGTHVAYKDLVVLPDGRLDLLR